MKRAFTILLVAVSIAINAFPQVPKKISYQAVIRNSSNQLVTNQEVGMKVSLLQGTSTGAIIYQETYNPNLQTNANGLVSVEIGGGIPIAGTFSDIDWSAGSYFLKIETDPTGGTNYTITGTSQILSVPYALYAKKAENGFSGNYNNLTNLPTFATVAITGNYFDLVDLPALFDGNYNSLINQPTLFDGAWTSIIGKPTTLTGYSITDALSTSHPANGITSAKITNWNTAYGWGNHIGLYRPISYVPAWTEITSKPTTLTGFGITDAVSTTENQTIGGNKTFNNTIIASNGINFNNKNITNVATPINDNDAANKAYVDEIKKTIYDELLNAGLNGIVKDVEENAYKTKKIGTQIWMAENLETTKYNDGTDITPGYYCWYNNDAAYKTLYGVLYKWYAVNTGNLCPSGWHVPTETEWVTLDNYLIANGFNYDGTTTDKKIAKSLASAYGWASSSITGAVGNTDYPEKRNASGFTALPGGLFEYVENNFTVLGRAGVWWSATENDLVSAYGRWLWEFNNLGMDIDRTLKEHYFSVRCIKD